MPDTILTKLRSMSMKDDLWPLDLSTTIALGILVALWLGTIIGWMGAIWTMSGTQ